MYKDFRDDSKEPKKDIMGELTFSNMISQQAIINILIKKGILTKEEVIAETKKVKERWELMKDMNMDIS
jgi:hypothetical protein